LQVKLVKQLEWSPLVYEVLMQFTIPYRTLGRRYYAPRPKTAL
jgi:hypothetical protein